METQPEAISPESRHSGRFRLPTWATFCEAAVFVVFTAFFIAYGVVPIFGGDGLGLVGAEGIEPPTFAL